MREAPSITIINELLKREASIVCYDPVAMNSAKKIFKQTISFAKTPIEAVGSANALIILTEWQEFRSLDLSIISKKLIDKIIFDGRNIYNPKQVAAHGLSYESIGRPTQD